jgi:hypothetical protein
MSETQQGLISPDPIQKFHHELFKSTRGDRQGARDAFFEAMKSGKWSRESMNSAALKSGAVDEGERWTQDPSNPINQLDHDSFKESKKPREVVIVDLQKATRTVRLRP